MALFTSRTDLSSAVQLSPPATTNDCSVLAALGRRRTIRDISSTSLPSQIVSNLLWAAFGINRPADSFGVPGRTAASASNSQEIDLYIATKEGVYLYEARKHILQPIVAEDLRPMALRPGQHSIDAEAPLTIIYVADIHRLTSTQGYKDIGLQDPEMQKAYCYVDTGLIAANVYLYAAAEGLAAWFHNCDREGLAKALSLRSNQRVLFAQSVGNPDRSYCRQHRIRSRDLLMRFIASPPRRKSIAWPRSLSARGQITRFRCQRDTELHLRKFPFVQDRGKPRPGLDMTQLLEVAVRRFAPGSRGDAGAKKWAANRAQSPYEDEGANPTRPSSGRRYTRGLLVDVSVPGS